jgi:hypothetical protein
LLQTSLNSRACRRKKSWLLCSSYIKVWLKSYLFTLYLTALSVALIIQCRMVQWLVNWNRRERGWSWFNSRYCPTSQGKKTEGNHTKLRQNCQPFGQDFNPGHPATAVLLPIQPRLSIKFSLNFLICGQLRTSSAVDSSTNKTMNVTINPNCLNLGDGY